MEPEIDLDFLKSCLLEAGKIAFSQRGQMEADLKADLSPVTKVDKQVEGYLIRRIIQRYPGHMILSEESGLNTEESAQPAGVAKSTTAGYAWVIDPIDGTRAFASGLPIWGVSIGILKQNEVFAGGFYLPVTGEMYWGDRQEAFYNDRSIQPLGPVDLHSPLVFLAVPSEFHHQFTVAYPRIRSLGSTAAHLAYVAVGAAVGALTSKASLWDLAGMLPILSAAGVSLAYLDGQGFDPASVVDGRPILRPLLAAHPSVMGALREMIQLNPL